MENFGDVQLISVEKKMIQILASHATVHQADHQRAEVDIHFALLLL
jgi:hypothetical protein